MTPPQLSPKELALLNKIEQELQKYTQLYALDGSISVTEQAELDAIKQKLQKIKQHLAQTEDPIEKQINYELYISLETFIYVQVWDLNHPSKTPILQQKVELESETNIPSIVVPAYSKINVNTWAKATFINANLFTDNEVEVLQKDFTATIRVNKQGNFTVEDAFDTVVVNNHQVLKDYAISLNIEYINGGEKIRLHADGFATAKVLEETYKNWDNKTKKQIQTFKDQVLKSIVPTLVFQPQPYIAPPTPSQELIFEKENQAVLSSDQTKYLQEWWSRLSPNLKQEVEQQKAIILVEGYTSHSGTDLYNIKLGDQRAEHVKEILNMVIGKRQGIPKAIIDTKSIGEFKESRRYVKITILPN